MTLRKIFEDSKQHDIHLLAFNHITRQFAIIQTNKNAGKGRGVAIVFSKTDDCCSDFSENVVDCCVSMLSDEEIDGGWIHVNVDQLYMADIFINPNTVDRKQHWTTSIVSI